MSDTPPFIESVQLEFPHFWLRFRYCFRKPLAEFLGTMIMVLFLEAVVAQMTLSEFVAGTFYSKCVVTGLAALLGILIAGPISGAHMNPSITLAFTVFRKFPAHKAPGYILGQELLGGFTGAAIVYGNYRSAIDAHEGGSFRTHKTAGIFSTYPEPFLTTTGQFFSEVIATAMLVIGVLAIFNPKHPQIIRDLAPLWVFFIVMMINAALGWETGSAMSMARDLGPRFFSYLAGYGSDVWSDGNYYSWVPVIAPLFGSLIGGFVYDLLIHQSDSPTRVPMLGLWPVSSVHRIERFRINRFKM